jgi:hypothetical protein
VGEERNLTAENAERLQEIEERLQQISQFPWKLQTTAGGEFWITVPDNSDHDFREDFEPIYESSGRSPQLHIDGKFLAESPEIIQELVREIRRYMGKEQESNAR